MNRIDIQRQRRRKLFSLRPALTNTSQFPSSFQLSYINLSLSSSASARAFRQCGPGRPAVCFRARETRGLPSSQEHNGACQQLSAREASPLIPPAEPRAALPAPPSPRQPPQSHGYPPPPTPVSACSFNELGAEGATALASDLSALTKLQTIDVR